MIRQGITAGFIALAVMAAASAETATYRVTFDATWSQSTHPDAFPNGAHFSPIIGGTHNSDVTFWEPGGLATPGIESMAETGATTLLRNEVNVAIANGDANSVVTGFPTLFVPATRTFEIEVDSDFPLVTVVTMIAPSPDWFVGTSGLNLRSQPTNPSPSAWLPEIQVDLVPWDAGTDSGTMFGSPNQNTSPPEPIHRLDTLAGSVFEGAAPLGTITFELVPEPGSAWLALLALLPFSSYRRAAAEAKRSAAELATTPTSTLTPDSSSSQR